MLAHALLPAAEGGFGFGPGDEIGIWGIHLATEKEYLEQRPNMEWLIGRAQERGLIITMPKECPLLKHRWEYAFEKRPDFGSQRCAWEAQRMAQEAQRLGEWLMGPRDTPAPAPKVEYPLWVAKDDPQARRLYALAAQAEAQGRQTAAKLREQGLAA